MINRKNILQGIGVSGLFLLGAAILFIRNPDPIFNPVLYAEDAIWAAQGISDGWLKTMIDAKPGYFVALNIISLFVASKISVLLSGNPIAELPYGIALISYAFYSAVATLAFVTLRAVSATWFAAIGFILFLNLPLGNSLNEIIGRLLQIGFCVPFLALMCVFWRGKVSPSRRLFIDSIIILFAGTNPIVVPIVVCYVLVELIFFKQTPIGHQAKDLSLGLPQNHTALTWLRENGYLLVGLAALVVALSQKPDGASGVPGDFVPSALIEAALGRPIFYPLLFPYYEFLNDKVVVMLTLLLAAFATLIYIKTPRENTKKLILLGVIGLVLLDLATIIKRYALTSYLDHYQQTYPDRYFMGINLIAVFLLLVLVAELLKTIRFKFVGYILTVSIATTYLLGMNGLYEITHTNLPIRVFFDFKEQLCLGHLNPGDRRTTIASVYPEPWVISLPTNLINKDHCLVKSDLVKGLDERSAQHKMVVTPALSEDRQIELIFPDANLFANRKINRLGIAFGTYARKNSGSAQIELINQSGKAHVVDINLGELKDNSYYYIDLPADTYVSGVIKSLGGKGVSVWQSLSLDGSALSCAVFEFEDKSRRYIPGCFLLDSPVAAKASEDSAYINVHSSEPLSASHSIPLLFAPQLHGSPINRMGIAFNAYGRINAGEAAVNLVTKSGKSYTTHIVLSNIKDNRYYYLDVQPDSYISGSISSLGGSGVSVWEHHETKEQIQSCLILEFTDNTQKHTKGCQLLK